ATLGRARIAREAAGGSEVLSDFSSDLDSEELDQVRFLRAVWAPDRRRLVAGLIFAAITVAACLLVGRRLTTSSWPLAHTRTLLVALAAFCYFVSFILRARGWHRLFPHEQRPDQARCLASVGAAAASGVVLPFRLDYLVKIGTIRKLKGVRVGFE